MIYNEKMTGTKRDRLVDRITEGDTVVIESLSRLGRSTKDLIELTELFQNKSVHLVSLKEQIDTSTSTGKLLFTLMSAIAQFERDVIADRTREGLHNFFGDMNVKMAAYINQTVQNLFPLPRKAHKIQGQLE